MNNSPTNHNQALVARMVDAGLVHHPSQFNTLKKFTCISCGQTFYRYWDTAKYCSIKCKADGQRLRK